MCKPSFASGKILSNSDLFSLLFRTSATSEYVEQMPQDNLRVTWGILVIANDPSF